MPSRLTLVHGSRADAVSEALKLKVNSLKALASRL